VPMLLQSLSLVQASPDMLLSSWDLSESTSHGKRGIRSKNQ